MSISKTTVDVRFQPVNQQAPKTSAPVGRLAKMTNAVANEFEGTYLKPEQRRGFRQYTKKVVDPTLGIPVTANAGFAGTPELMSSLESQFVVVADSNPYVLAENADEWARTPYILHPLAPRMRPIYTSNVQIMDPDSAAVGNVVCFVYKQTDPVTGFVSCWAEVRDIDGTVLMMPNHLGEVDANGRCQIKVVSNGVVFWVFQSYDGTMKVHVIKPDGGLSGVNTFANILIPDSSECYWWDVQFNCNGVTWFGSTNAAWHQSFTFVQPGPGLINVTQHDYSAVITPVPGRPFWLTNPYDATHSFLGILEGATTARMFVEKFNNVNARIFEHQMESGITLARQCEVAGYVDQAATISTLRSELDTTNPVYNKTVQWKYTTDPLDIGPRVFQSVTLASRSFFVNGRPTGIFYFNDDVQPTFFVHDLVTRTCCGMWNHGTSAQDWQGTPGDPNQTKNYAAFNVPSPYVDQQGGIHCAVGYMAESFSKSFTTYTRTGTNPIVAIVNSKFVSTIGVGDIEWAKPGFATEYADELMIPGMLATCFSGTIFSEDNFNLFPSPFTFAQSHNDAGNLELDGKYSIVVVLESTDTRGNRIKSRPSDPIVLTMTGSNNICTISGPTLFETEGKSNVIISIYSSYLISGVPSTDHRKITDDLKPVLNNKGSLTWSFIFNLTSAEIQVGEILYTDNALLPHDPCPAHSVGCIAGNRMIVAGYDGALWYSDEKQEGEPLVFNVDVRRVLMPTSDKVVSMQTLDSMRVVVLCSKSVWEFDISQLPGPDGLNGNVQAPKRLPFPNGCNLLSTVVKEGILYTSDAGGIWLVSRGLENQQVSGPEYKDIVFPIIGMATDAKQRTFIGLQKSDHFTSIVRDGINLSWSDNTHPRKIVLVHSFNGSIVYCDDISVHKQDESTFDTYTDDITHTTVVSQVDQDISFEPMNFGGIKGLKCIWKFILHGQYLGPHNLTVDATYDTEDGVFTESWHFTPDPTLQYDYQFEPKVIEMSAISIRVRSDRVTLEEFPSLAFSLESISFEIGVDSYLNRSPATRTPTST
jgi:hypothetical protein